MNTRNYLFAEEILEAATARKSAAIRELERKWGLPVSFWLGQEPLFAQNAKAILSMLKMKVTARSYE